MSLFEFTTVTVAEATAPPDKTHLYLASRKWQPPKPLPPDRVLVLVYYGIGVVQEHSGEGAAYWFECVGHGEFCESVGGVPKEDGLWVFEGGIIGHTYHTYNGTEYDSEFDGEFRRMTDEEREVWIADEGTVVALWDDEINEIMDECPCVNCGEPRKAHTEKWAARPRIAVILPKNHFREWYGRERVLYCPEKSPEGG